jgi:hemerythrin superfamily protein
MFWKTNEVEDTVNEADKDRAEAAKLPAGDVVAILYTQHAAVRDVMDTVESTSGSERKRAFEELATMLKAHETAEESVVRPVTQQTAGAEVATARNAEEDEANQVLAALKTLQVDSADFDAKFADFKRAVSDHAEAEEHDEFPSILTGRTVDERHELGLKFLATFESSGGTI